MQPRPSLHRSKLVDRVSQANRRRPFYLVPAERDPWQERKASLWIMAACGVALMLGAFFGWVLTW